MDTYDKAAAATSRAVMDQFSTSFGLATKLFGATIRQDIYNIYALVRLADEIVDSYRGKYARQYLDNLEQETYAAMAGGFSTNLVVHAFQKTANVYGIKKALIAPFFDSMRADLQPEKYEVSDYQTYIYGSAAVVGLMCLRVFCNGNDEQYKSLEIGARALGEAFQKVNFLRDLKADYETLGRYYFPIGSFDGFHEQDKVAIIRDIKRDLSIAKPAIKMLPIVARPAVLAAYRYYSALLNKLSRASAEDIKTRRLRLPNARKFMVLSATKAQYLGRQW